MKPIATVLTLATFSATAFAFAQALPFRGNGRAANNPNAGGTLPAAAPAGGRAGGGARGGAPAPTGIPANLTLTKLAPDGKPHTFATKNKQFQIDGDPTILIAGEMHFGRIQPSDFELRVKQAKAMGLNTISFYMFWNISEPKEGTFDFTGMNDVHRMLKICQDNGMWAVLRPGPYCCAEVEYGGIPAWTLKGDNANVKIRTTDPKYQQWSKDYITRLGKEIADMQVTKGGPLLMVQMENEFGMVAGASGGYDSIKGLVPVFRNAGFDVPLYVCDPGGAGGGAANPYGDTILRGRNGMGVTNDQAYQQMSNAMGDFPIYSPEVYTAWFAGWGQPLPNRHSAIAEITNETNSFLDHNISWCYYVFFGGTNWGYNTGCNEYLPVQTSYDYNAPIDEAGRATPKYKALRDILSTRTGRTLPPIPEDPPVMTLPAITFNDKQPLLDTLPAKPTLSSPKTVSMEDLDQSYGFVLYRKKFPDGIKGTLTLKGAQDYTITMINGKIVGKSYVGYGPESNTITLNQSGPVTLDLLVHNLGRISVIVNSSVMQRARRGILDGAYLDDKQLADWDIYSLPLDSAPAITPNNAPQTGPEIYHSTFNVDKPAGTFLDMSNWTMGVVYVNGHNLGRYWDRGATRALFCPAEYLKAGTNDIAVLELLQPPSAPTITGKLNMVTTDARPFVLNLDAGRDRPTPNARGVPEPPIK